MLWDPSARLDGTVGAALALGTKCISLTMLGRPATFGNPHKDAFSEQRSPHSHIPIALNMHAFFRGPQRICPSREPFGNEPRFIDTQVDLPNSASILRCVSIFGDPLAPSSRGKWKREFVLISRCRVPSAGG